MYIYIMILNLQAICEATEIYTNHSSDIKKYARDYFDC